MFRHILVPTDLTEKSLRALEIAVLMGQMQEDGRVTLLHVVETIEDVDSGDFDDFYQRLGRRAVRKMEKIVSQLRGPERAIGSEVLYGKRVREILRFAEEQEVDLIVLSSHRIDPENATQGWGTISYKVGILAPCPVMLVK